MLVYELFKGLQRDFPFAFKSKDPPTALLWLTFGGSYIKRNMQFHIFYNSRQVYQKSKSRKSPHNRHTSKVSQHHESL